jgi:hypothetical protein
MAKRTISISFPPFHVLAKHLVQDEDFLSDAKILLDIDDTKYSKLANSLIAEKDFIDRNKLNDIVQSVLGTNDQAKVISKIIWRLHKLMREQSNETLERSIELLGEAINEHSESLSKEQHGKLIKRIEELVVSPQSLSRQQKAEELAESIGKELESLQLICDIRPVFDESRSNIEGAIPISMLILDYADPGGSTSRIEIRMTEEQIRDLCDKSQHAKNKILVLKRMLTEKSISLPNTPATMDER